MLYSPYRQTKGGTTVEWTLQQAVRETGISADTLRYYDKEGMVPAKRRANGYRYYSDDDILILKNIVVMKYAHFSLEEIKALEEHFLCAPDANCNAIFRETLGAKSAELRQIAANYLKIAGMMEELLAMMETPEAYRQNYDKVYAYIAGVFDDIKTVRKGD